jgi:hypothetical protein
MVYDATPSIYNILQDPSDPGQPFDVTLTGFAFGTNTGTVTMCVHLDNPSPGAACSTPQGFSISVNSWVDDRITATVTPPSDASGVGAYDMQVTSKGLVGFETSFYAAPQVTTAQSTPKGIVQVAPVGPHPTNLQQVGPGEDQHDGAGTLLLYYTLDSSTGNPLDLQGCNVGEYVQFIDTFTGNVSSANPFPYPAPFPADQQPNPTIVSVAADVAAYKGSGAGFTDAIRFGVPATFRPPYVRGNVTAVQTIRYQCPWVNNNAWQALAGPLTISRDVKPDPNGGQSWYFSACKDNLTRQKNSWVRWGSGSFPSE